MNERSLNNRHLWSVAVALKGIYVYWANLNLKQIIYNIVYLKIYYINIIWNLGAKIPLTTRQIPSEVRSERYLIILGKV